MTYESGDSVIIGEYGKVHWDVISAWRLPVREGGEYPEGEQVLILESPMSQRKTSQLERYVRPWSP